MKSTKLKTLSWLLVTSLVPSLSFASTKVIFSSTIEGQDPSGLGVFVRDALESKLTEYERITLLDRKQLTTALGETATSELKTTSTDSQLNISGANFAVYPKITSFKENTIFTYKVVDLSTTKYRSAMVRSNEDTDPLTLVEQSSSKIIETIELLSKSEIKDTANKSWKLAADKPRFTVAIRIPEASAAQQNPDPSGEKELSSVLLENKFTIKQLSRPSQSTSAQLALHLEGKEHDKLMDECRKKSVEILILGLASSDDATRFGSYHISKARIELTAVRVSDSKVLVSTKGYGKASDLSNMVSEKKAIEDAVKRVAPEFIETMVSTQP